MYVCEYITWPPDGGIFPFSLFAILIVLFGSAVLSNVIRSVLMIKAQPILMIVKSIDSINMRHPAEKLKIWRQLNVISDW